MEVGLSPGDFVFDGDPAAPRKKGTSTPTQFFGPCLLWRISWMDEDATWYGSRPRPRPRYIRRGPSSPRERGTAAPSPLLGPCLLWPRSPIWATAEFLFLIVCLRLPVLRWLCLLLPVSVYMCPCAFLCMFVFDCLYSSLYNLVKNNTSLIDFSLHI